MPNRHCVTCPLRVSPLSTDVWPRRSRYALLSPAPGPGPLTSPLLPKGPLMQRWFPGLLVVLAWASSAPAAGLLIPNDSNTPLAMLDHKVKVTIDEQVAVTRVEQTFRNHTDRQLEATYVFPV